MSKFKFITMLLVASFVIMGVTLKAEEKEKEFHKSWPAGNVETLEISNKYGEVKVKNEGGSDITVDVIITVEGANEKKVNELLGKINVNFRKSGTTAKAETTIENNFKSQRKFSIDYEVNIPSDKNLNITNKYGHTIVSSLNANGNFVNKYGNLQAGSLKAPEGGKINVAIDYGNGSIEECGDVTINLAYSNLSIEEMNGVMQLTSKYSDISVEEGQAIKIDSKYDKFTFQEVESVKANTKYSHIKIGELSKRLIVESGYGSVRVSEVSSNFEEISITNSYGQISLGLDESSYSVHADCSYCGINYPEERFKGNKIKERNTQTIEGQIGNGGGTVVVKSRYGDIKLK